MEKLATSLILAAIVTFSVAVTGQVRPGQCGVDRWRVKTLTDHDRLRVSFAPVNSSVAKLAAIRIHEIPYPEDGRIEPEELTVYRIRARLRVVRPEKDKDLHVILADLDNDELRMIVEIPAPECASGSGHEADFRRSRSIVPSLETGRVVEVVGVGFFDYLHNAKDGLKNGLELHPVLSINAVQTTEKNL